MLPWLVKTSEVMSLESYEKWQSCIQCHVFKTTFDVAGLSKRAAAADRSLHWPYSDLTDVKQLWHENLNFYKSSSSYALVGSSTVPYYADLYQLLYWEVIMLLLEAK